MSTGINVMKVKDTEGYRAEGLLKIFAPGEVNFTTEILQKVVTA